MLDSIARAGEMLEARLKRTGTPAIAQAGGVEYLLPKGAPGATEGSAISILVTREAVPGGEPWKRPLSRLAEADDAHAPIEGDSLPFPSPADRLGQLGWTDLVEEARSGIVRFQGGELRISVTPAMTLIDVDGTLAPDELAVRSAAAAASAIGRHSIGGSIGVDFPTLAGKAQRLMVDQAIDISLPRPFERTATNGFGFLQIVRPRRYASTFELAQDRGAFEARALLRRCAFDEPGPKRLVAHPAVIAVLVANHGWIEALGRQLGGEVSLRSDASLPIHGAYGENL